MVCSKCEKKLAKIACPDPWKDGSRGLAGGKEGARPGGGNKALSSAKRFQPYSCKCAVCKQSLHQQGIYCQTCAYAKGVCAMCGIQILDVTYYKQSGVGDVEAAAKRREEDNERFKVEVQQAEAKRAARDGDVAPALAKLTAAQAPSRAAPGHATAALAAGLAAAGGATGGAFMLERSWVGPRPGYFFSTGHLGTGYYLDSAQRVLASAHAAAASAAAAVPVHAAASTLAGGAAGAASAGAAAAQFATAAVPARHEPASMAAAAAARATATGGSLTSSMGAAGRVVQAKGDAGGAPPPGWPYDPGSGYYFDAASQLYWDPATKLFFDCGKNEWRATQQPAGAPPPQKARVVDKWGL